MANLADCAFAVAKDDIYKMNGAIRRAEPGEKCMYVTKSIYKDGDDEYTYWFKWVEGAITSCRLKKGGKVLYDTSDKGEMSEVNSMLSKMMHIGFTETVKDIHVENGWAVNWQKLNTYSYEYTPSIHEFDDHITVYFGGRWSFPSHLEDKLNELGVKWQGAGCEDGMDWQDDEMGNYDFGLRVKSEEEYCGGERYLQHYVEDMSSREFNEEVFKINK